MNKIFKGLTLSVVLGGLVFVSTACDPELTDLSLQADSVNAETGTIDASDVVDSEPIDALDLEPGTDTVTEPDEEVTPKFAAVILNGTCGDFIFNKGTNVTGGANATLLDPDDKDMEDLWDNDQDNADAFDMNPPSDVKTNAFVDNSASPYTWDNNDDLDAAIIAASSCSDGSEVAGTTSTSQDSGSFGYKMNETNRRMYQPFDVEVGVTYTISLYVKMEATNSVTFYALNKIISSEATLSTDSDASLKVTGDTDNQADFVKYDLEFTATTVQAVFYAVPDFTDQTVTKNDCEYGGAEIFVDNITIVTHGLE